MSNNTDRDIELMLSIKKGDKSAFEELYHLYKGPIGNLFYRLCGNQSIAEECLQEVFYRIWLYRETYQPRSKVLTYLFSIAKNYWINEGKRLKHKPVAFTTLTAGNPGSQITPIDTKQPEPDETALSRELKETIKKAITHLPEKERLVVVMSQYEELKYTEIAEILEIAEITVKTRMAKAMKRLKKYLSKYLQ